MKRLTWITGAAVLALCLGSGIQSSIAQEQDQTQEARQEQQQQREQEQGDPDQQEAQRQGQEDQRAQQQQRREQEEREQQRQPEQQQDQQQDQQRQEADRQRQGTRQQRMQDRIELGLRLEDYGDELVVSQVRDQSLAAQAGLQAEDRIVSINGRSVRSVDQLREAVRTLSRERGRVPLIIIRDGERQTTYLDLDRYRQQARRVPRLRERFDRQEAWLGVVLDPRFEDVVVVRRVIPDSAADQAGVQEGDWIIGINDRRVQSPAHLTRIIDTMRPGDRVQVHVARRVRQTVEARLGDMGQRSQDDRFARRPGDRFERRFDERFEDDYRSGYRGVPDEDVFEEEEPEAEDDDPQERTRRPLRDRLDRDDDQRPLRDRAEGVRDRIEERRGDDNNG